jgi:hypothetical protein
MPLPALPYNGVLVAALGKPLFFTFGHSEHPLQMRG